MPLNELKKIGWKFIGDNGQFSLDQPQETSFLYFPLANEAGMLSAISPNLHGDIKSNQYTFLTPPVSVEDLHNSRASRNFWVYIKGKGAWSTTGNSVKQTSGRFTGPEEQVILEAGFLWHKITRLNQDLGLKSVITSFVPVQSDKAELMKISITNVSNEVMHLTPTAAIPLYGRSADEIRDHRHVTSLLHRIYTTTHGIQLQPSLSFDERGHRVNKVTYNVLGSEGDGTPPVGFSPILEEYNGEGGCLDWPELIVKNLPAQATQGENFEGHEAMGAIRFQAVTLAPGESKTYVVAMIITDDREDEQQYLRQYVSEVQFDAQLKLNEQFWFNKLNTVMFHSGDKQYDQWMKWVTLQPVLRRIYGNSYLPYHDYGKGGRGWRDLWQDCLALLISEPKEVRGLLLNNFAGVRMDGSNATIIGSGPGEFVADRNQIPRVWMDHGAWPFLTTLFYINQTGDLDFLLEQMSYFKDSHVKRSKETDFTWSAEEGNKLKSADGQLYTGTILEHLLLQNLVPFFNVGVHNNCKLEDADWNDGLDMAAVKGESVAFTAFYASNLLGISELLLTLKKTLGLSQIELAEDMMILFDSLTTSINYESVSEKLVLLERFLNTSLHKVSGTKIKLDIEQLAADLVKKADWIKLHLAKNEWISNSEGFEWFNGYYNNDGARVEGDHPDGVRMTLTGQVFSIMGGIATEDQVAKITKAVNRYLKDPQIGYRLNTRFNGIQQNLGRAFGFAFGHKENGAMFSHMTVMYANSLYKRGFVKEGHAVLKSVYDLSINFERSRMYPGVPEYINEKGRGMYPYLTGSASWLLLTNVTEVYGIKGRIGDLQLEPKLLKDQFDGNNQASIITLFANKSLKVVYNNPDQLDYQKYTIRSVELNGEDIAYESMLYSCIINQSLLASLSDEMTHLIEVFF
jgi:cellobiose phosphorylase